MTNVSPIPISLAIDVLPFVYPISTLTHPPHSMPSALAVYLSRVDYLSKYEISTKFLFENDCQMVLDANFGHVERPQLLPFIDDCLVDVVLGFLFQQICDNAEFGL